MTRIAEIRDIAATLRNMSDGSWGADSGKVSDANYAAIDSHLTALESEIAGLRARNGIMRTALDAITLYTSCPQGFTADGFCAHCEASAADTAIEALEGGK